MKCNCPGINNKQCTSNRLWLGSSHICTVSVVRRVDGNFGRDSFEMIAVVVYHSGDTPSYMRLIA